MRASQIFLLIVISGLCSGSLYPLIKIANFNAIPKFAYIFWEGLVICIFIAVWSHIHKKRRLFNIREMPYYLFCALTNILIPQYIAFKVAAHMPSSWISITNILTPSFVYIGLVLFFRERFEKLKATGLFMGLLGAGLLFLLSLTDIVRPDKWMWMLISILLPLDYAVNRIYAHRLRPKDAPSDRLSFGFFSVVTFISGMLMLFTQTTYVPFVNINPGDIALLVHAFLLMIFYLIFFVLNEKGAIHSSLSFYIAPLTGILWGAFFFGEDINVIYILAGVFIFYGLYLVNKKTAIQPD